MAELLRTLSTRSSQNNFYSITYLGYARQDRRASGREAVGLPVAIVHKSRLSGSEVSVRSITGNVRGRAPIVVDDMISTGGTVAAAIKSLLAGGSEPYNTVVASHGLFVGPAVGRLRAAPLRRIVVTDSVGVPEGLGLLLEVVGLAPLLARAITCLHDNRSLEGLLTHA